MSKSVNLSKWDFQTQPGVFLHVNMFKVNMSNCTLRPVLPTIYSYFNLSCKSKPEVKLCKAKPAFTAV